MSYIAVDLDALNVAPDLGRAAGISEDRAIYGLVRLWAWCFRTCTDQASPTHVRGFFGADCSDALVEFGFLEPRDDGYRVRGASRYLRVVDGRRKGGLAAAARGNLKRGTQRPSSTPPTLAPMLEPAPGDLQLCPSSHSSSTPAFHRRPNTEEDLPLAPGVASGSVSEPKPKRQKALKTVDPRHAPLVDALTKAGASFDGGRDAANVSALLALATQAVGAESAAAEVESRWLAAMAHEGYPRVRTLTELRARWGHFGEVDSGIIGHGPIRAVTEGVF